MKLSTTRAGRSSLIAAACFGLLMSVFGLLVASGQRGGEGFFDNLWLGVPFLGAYVAGVLAFVFGVKAIVFSGERKVPVFAAAILGGFVTSFGVLEVLFPH